MYKLKSDNVFLQSANGINEICQPLRRLNITHFTYLKNFFDGSQVYLSDSAKWIDDYYQLGLYKSSLFEGNPDSYRSGCFSWPKEDNSPVFLHGREYFDSDNGITLIRKNENNCEFYFFSGSVNAKALNDFYLNNIDLLEKFVLYFKDSARNIIKKADKNKLIFPKNIKQNISQSNLIVKQSLALRTEFLKEINMDVPTNTILSHTQLSKRESDIASQLLKGKTAGEIGQALIISKRTAERHLENIKIKLNCKNKAELIKLLLMKENL